MKNYQTLTEKEHNTHKQFYNNESPKNASSEPTELSYDQLKDEYPHSLEKDITTYINDNEDLLKTDVLTFFNNALKTFPYKDFIDSLVYIVVNKMRINIFNTSKHDVPLLIAKQYKERYKNISAKIDAENAQKEADKKAAKDKRKQEILKDINSGNISDLRYLMLIPSENSLFSIINKNNLIYKAYHYDDFSEYEMHKLNTKSSVLLLIRGKGLPYLLFVAKTESDLKDIIVRSKITTKPYDSINDARKYYSGPVGEIPGYLTDGGVEDTTSVKSASVSYNDLLKYGHANRRDNYQNKYNNQDYWENDMNIYEQLNKIDDNKSLNERLHLKESISADMIETDKGVLEVEDWDFSFIDDGEIMITTELGTGSIELPNFNVEKLNSSLSNLRAPLILKVEALHGNECEFNSVILNNINLKFIKECIKENLYESKTLNRTQEEIETLKEDTPSSSKSTKDLVEAAKQIIADLESKGFVNSDIDAIGTMIKNTIDSPRYPSWVSRKESHKDRLKKAFPDLNI